MKRLLQIIFCFLFYSFLSWAHPHVFFDLHARIQIEGKQLEEIHFSLSLDEMNSLLQQKLNKKKEQAPKAVFTFPVLLAFALVLVL